MNPKSSIRKRNQRNPRVSKDNASARTTEAGEIIKILAGIAAILGAASWSQPLVSGVDLWWHLAAGLEYLRRGTLLNVDIFSHTFNGHPWINHEWLWGLIVASLWRVDPQLVAWGNFAVVIGVLALAYFLALRESGSRLAAGAAVWLFAACAHWFFDIRPHLCSLLFLGVFLVTREWRGAPWLWPPLMLVWVNLHAGFTFGLAAMGWLAVTRTIDGSRAAGRLMLPTSEVLGLAGAILAMLVNPIHFRILAYPLEYLNSGSPFRDIVEWLPPELSLNVTIYAGRFWLLVALTALGLPVASERTQGHSVIYFTSLCLAVIVAAWLKFAPLAVILALLAVAIARPGRGFMPSLALVALAMAVTSRRFIPLYGLIAAPVAAQAIAWAHNRCHAHGLLLRTRAARIGAIALALAAALWLWKDVRLFPDLLDRWTQQSSYPLAALRYLREVVRPQRLFNEYSWGGFLMLYAPELRVFIDPRANTVYDGETYLYYHRIIVAESDAVSRLVRQQVDAAFIGTEGPLVEALSGAGWRIVYQDRLATILVPPGSPTVAQALPPPEQVLGRSEPQIRFMYAGRAAMRHDAQAAEAEIEEVISKHPLLVQAYGEMAFARAIGGDIEGIAQAIARGIDVEPRWTVQLRLMEAQAYEIAGDLRRAVAALRRARPTGPFDNPESVDHLIKLLDARIANEGHSP
jgi:hypothetical protein